MRFGLFVLFVGCMASCSLPSQDVPSPLVSGVPWYTEDGSNVSAHGGSILKEGYTFYFFGEYKNNQNNQFEGFSCYSSTDLVNWTFEGLALPPNEKGRLSGFDCIGERPKVMKCPATGEFVMYFHADSNAYRNPAVEYAVSKSITGPYTYKGPLLFGDEAIRRWDLGTFQDDDGTGYLILHHGDIYKLSEDYKRVVEQVLKRDPVLRAESPAVFKRNGLYYWLGSGLTGWERNDNVYFTAPALSGPWTRRGTIAPKGTLTWNSQCTFVFPVVGREDTTYIYMGDRWSFPKQQAAATYVWQPLVFDGELISMPVYLEGWTIDVVTGAWKEAPLQPDQIIGMEDSFVDFRGNWEQVSDSADLGFRANTKDASVSLKFSGSQVALRGLASIDCGYGEVSIKNINGETVHQTWIDMYSNKAAEGLQYLSPILPQGDYILTFSPTESHWYWTEKSGKQWGSQDTYISLSEVWVFE